MTRNIDALDAAKIYIVAELSKIFSAENLQNGLVEGVHTLSEKQIWRLLEALSFTYRLNSMFWCLGDTSFSWREEEVDCTRLTLTRMNPYIDIVTHRDDIQGDPIKFRDYLIQYFRDNPDSDPEHLGQFRPSEKTIQYPVIFLKEEEGKLYLLDGSNRLVAHLLKGGNVINAIIGTKTQEGKPRIGDSTFWMLSRAFEKCATPEEKSAILSTVKIILGSSSDGAKAIQEYWIDHSKNEETKKAGRELLLENKEIKQ